VLFIRTLSNCRIAQREFVKDNLVPPSDFYVITHNKTLNRLINSIFDSITRATNSLKDGGRDGFETKDKQKINN